MDTIELSTQSPMTTAIPCLTCRISRLIWKEKTFICNGDDHVHIMPTSLVNMPVTCDREIVEVEEAEKEERDDGEMDNIELDDLSDSDGELWLIWFVLLLRRDILP